MRATCEPPVRVSFVGKEMCERKRIALGMNGKLCVAWAAFRVVCRDSVVEEHERESVGIVRSDLFSLFSEIPCKEKGERRSMGDKEREKEREGEREERGRRLILFLFFFLSFSLFNSS